MTYTIIFEKIVDPKFNGYYYAHIPSLDLTTHGLGIEGAKEAAKNLITLWLEEKRSSGEELKPEAEMLISKLEI